MIRAKGRLALGFMLTSIVACAGGGAVEGGPAGLPEHSFGLEPDWRKAPKTSSGWTSSIGGPSPTEESFVCGKGDRALREAARAFAKTRTPEQGAPTATELKLAVQREGSPLVWPRAAMAWGTDPQALTKSIPPAHKDEERCGEALERRADGTYALVWIFASAKGSLDPIPRSVRVGEWVSINATLSKTAQAVKVYIAHDNEAPYAIPTTLDRGHVIARFAAKAPGLHNVQVVATAEGGPVPVLEAAVFADTTPSDDRYLRGDKLEVSTDPSPEGRLLAYILAARDGAPLVRRADLDRVAQAHSERMRSEKTLAHTVGDGTAADRVLGAHISAKIIGENVALAKTVEEAHQALMASPSHRGNILSRDFRSIGLSVLTDESGNVWVTEVFTTP